MAAANKTVPTDADVDVHDSGREALLARLGRHRRGKGCVYTKRLADVDLGALEELCVAALKEPRA